ncbi:MAG: hypothetical protein AB1724_10370 [Thermodesulfobacteriota bacterium]
MHCRFTVTILGSGTCVPSLTRSACSLLMEITGVTAYEVALVYSGMKRLVLTHFYPARDQMDVVHRAPENSAAKSSRPGT